MDISDNERESRYLVVLLHEFGEFLLVTLLELLEFELGLDLLGFEVFAQLREFLDGGLLGVGAFLEVALEGVFFLVVLALALVGMVLQTFDFVGLAFEFDVLLADLLGQ